ncbi:MAG: hypothetical protein ABJP90_05145 [Paracoccaceae bacterium]
MNSLAKSTPYVLGAEYRDEKPLLFKAKPSTVQAARMGRLRALMALSDHYKSGAPTPRTKDVVQPIFTSRRGAKIF